ncbi:MAG: COG4315 family predicted lipoprotein [Solirubrobacteraceae bacterium]
MRRRSRWASALLAVAAVAGCGGSAAKPAPGAVAPTVAVQASRPAAGHPVASVKPALPLPAPSVTLRTAPGYGQLLVDAKGRTLYLFTADRGHRSACAGACATAWPPLLVSHAPRGGRGIRAGRLSLIRRAGGQTQLAYYGQPLYYYIGDRQPGQINCQDAEEFGGHWWLVKPNGRQNRSTP